MRAIHTLSVIFLTGGEISLRNVRPHPGPLSRGEGEWFTAALKCRGTGLARLFFAKRETGNCCSFSRGRRLG